MTNEEKYLLSAMSEEDARAILAFGPPPDPWADVFAKTDVEVNISHQLWREWRMDDA